MRSGRVSLVVIGAALIAAFAIPQCRRPIVEMVRLESGRGSAPAAEGEEAGVERFYPDAAAVAATHAQDWQSQLAAAESREIWAPWSEQAGLHYYREAARLKPDSAAPRFRMAAALLELVPFADEKFSDAPRLSEAQRKTVLDQAQSALLEARRLDPRNAAPDYLLAYVALARGNEEAAQRWLESALGKPGWTVYQREVLLARLRVYEQSGGPDLAAIVYAHAGGRYSNPPMRIKWVVRQIAKRADALRAAGKHEQAILWYWAGFRAGDLQESKGYDIMEVLAGKACAAVAIGSFLSEKEAEAIRARSPGAREGRDTQQLERLRKVLDEKRRRNFETYLRKHGREDLAQEHAQVTAQIERTYQRITEHVRSRRVLGDVLAAMAPMAVNTGVSEGVVVPLGALIWAWILWLILRRRMGEGRPTQWSWGQWGLLAVASFGPAVGPPFLLPAWMKQGFMQGLMGRWFWIPLAEQGGLVLFLLLTLVAMIVKRRRAGGAAIGGFRDYMHSLVVLLPATVALLVVMCVATLPAADRGLQRFKQQQVQKIEQGEMVYYGLRE